MQLIDAGEDGVSEGSVVYRRHKVYERDRELRKKKIAKVLHDCGELACEACGFDFARFYTDGGNGFIEVHHTTPVSQIKVGGKTKLEDLSLLCANCHRMAHRSKEILSVAELRERVVAAMQFRGCGTRMELNVQIF